MQVGWLPSVCLLELGAEDDPLIQDLIILFNNGNYNIMVIVSSQVYYYNNDDKIL